MTLNVGVYPSLGAVVWRMRRWGWSPARRVAAETPLAKVNPLGNVTASAWPSAGAKVVMLRREGRQDDYGTLRVRNPVEMQWPLTQTGSESVWWHGWRHSPRLVGRWSPFGPETWFGAWDW